MTKELGGIQQLDTLGNYIRGSEHRQAMQLNQQQLDANQMKMQQSQALQNLKTQAVNDPNSAAILARLDPEYAKQYQDYQQQKQVYYGSQAKAIASLPISMRNNAYANLYNNAKNAGENIDMFPVPDGEWSDVKQGALDYLANSSMSAEKQIAARQKQQEIAMGGQMPAPVKEYQYFTKLSPEEKADYKKLKWAEKGFSYDEEGNLIPTPGYSDIKANIKSDETKAKIDATNIQSKAGELNEMEAYLPQLEETVKELSKLGKTATYTKAGQAVDTALRQSGMPSRQAGIARSEYISLVDNQILPLLRQTFGAQFTEKEGQSLKATLGDPDKSPSEKDAVLRSFIRQKKAKIESLKREVSKNTKPNSSNQNSTDFKTKYKLD